MVGNAITAGHFWQRHVPSRARELPSLQLNAFCRSAWITADFDQIWQLASFAACDPPWSSAARGSRAGPARRNFRSLAHKISPETIRRQQGMLRKHRPLSRASRAGARCGLEPWHTAGRAETLGRVDHSWGARRRLNSMEAWSAVTQHA